VPKGWLVWIFTNHSLRATATTRLFENNVDEQLIMQCTSHSTTSGVHSYKRKLKAITSDVLNGSTRIQGQHKVSKPFVVESDEDVKCTRGSVDRGENNREVKPTSGSCVDSGHGSFVDSGGNNREVKSTTASCVEKSKKGNNLLPVLNLEGVTNFTINFNMAK